MGFDCGWAKPTTMGGKILHLCAEIHGKNPWFFTNQIWSLVAEILIFFGENPSEKKNTSPAVPSVNVSFRVKIRGLNPCFPNINVCSVFLSLPPRFPRLGNSSTWGTPLDISDFPIETPHKTYEYPITLMVFGPQFANARDSPMICSILCSPNYTPHKIPVPNSQPKICQSSQGGFRGNPSPNHRKTPPKKQPQQNPSTKKNNRRSPSNNPIELDLEGDLIIEKSHG